MHSRKTALLCLSALSAFQAGAQTIGGCPVFPANNIWNARVDTLPVHLRSGAWVNSIGPTATLHQDFGPSPTSGIPLNLVTGTQPKVPIAINEAVAESDPGPYPFPPDAKVEAGSDAHVLVVDTTNCVLYETYLSFKNPDNSWSVYSGAIFDLRRNLLRPQSWTSADAAGLPIMPGLARYEEIVAGEIRHALRFTAPRTNREFLWPARHYASSVNDPSLPSMGARFRLKANFDTSSFSPVTQIILTALKRYGMMVADNGSSWYVQGAGDPNWPDLADEWRRIPGSAFEAVDTAGLIDNIDSAAVRGSTVTPALQSATVTPSAVTGGLGATLRVTLSAPAPAGGVLVTLSSDNIPVAPVLPSATILEGASSVDIPLTTTSVAAQTIVTFTASLAGLTRQAALTVNAPTATLQSAVFLISTVTGGQGSTLRVSLSGAAPSGGVTVSLASGTPAVASIVGTAQIQAGGSSVDVPVSTTAVQSVTPVTFTATLAGVTRQAVLTVNPAASATLSSAVLTVPSLTGGAGARLRITLTQNAPAGGLVVALTSGNQGVAAILPSVTIPAGSSTVEVPVTTTPVGTQTQVLLSATLGAVSRQATLTVNPPALSTLAVSPTSVQGGTAASATVTLNGPAPAGGFTVTLVSNNTAAATTPNSVPVPAGQSSVTFPVTTKVVISNTIVQLQASAQGRSVTATLQVTPQKAKIKGVSTRLHALTLDVTVTLDGPAGPAGALVSLSGSDNAVAGLSGRQLTIGPGATSAVAAFAVNPPPSGSVTLAVTATLDGLSQSASVLITGRMVVIKELRVPARPAANSWANAVVELSSAVTGSLSAPVVATTGVISQTQWLYPIAAGRSYLVLSFRSSTAGTGTISVSYGGVTKVATVTFQ